MIVAFKSKNHIVTFHHLFPPRKLYFIIFFASLLLEVIALIQHQVKVTLLQILIRYTVKDNIAFHRKSYQQFCQQIPVKLHRSIVNNTGIICKIYRIYRIKAQINCNCLYINLEENPGGNYSSNKCLKD